MSEPQKIKITPLSALALRDWQKSLLGNIANHTELQKADLLDKIIGAGLHAIRENNYTFRLPLEFRVEDKSQRIKTKRAHKSAMEQRKTLTEEHLRACFVGETSIQAGKLAKKLKEISGAGESTCYRAISGNGYLANLLASSERGGLRLKSTA